VYRPGCGSVCTAGAAIPAGVFTHIAFTYDEGNAIVIYVNGQPATLGSLSGTLMPISTANTLYIGRQEYPAARYHSPALLMRLRYSAKFCLSPSRGNLQRRQQRQVQSQCFADKDSGYIGSVRAGQSVTYTIVVANGGRQ